MLFPESAALFAEVILPLNLPQTLTYGIPADLQDLVLPGMRVEVVLGNNKQYAGVVASVHGNKPEAYDVKPIRTVLDDSPILSTEQLLLWEWIGHYYMASPGEVMQAALPAHLKLMSETRVQWAPVAEVDLQSFTEHAQAAIALLRDRKGATIGDVRAVTGRQHLIAVLGELLDAEAIILNDALEEAYQPRQEKIVILNPELRSDAQKLQQAFAALDRSPRQLALLMAQLELSAKEEAVPQKTLLERAGASTAQLKTLVSKEIFFVAERDLSRLRPAPEKDKTTVALTPAQTEVYDDLNRKLETQDVLLLQGVTGSGKTLLYIRKIREIIASGKQALLLLPEIGLTTQLVGRLYRYFGNELGVYHSRFSNNERVEIWEKVRKGTYKIVAGPRSALWLPFDSLGIIIIDEEHDPSFKQRDPAPRFHARDAAIYYAGLHKAKVVLGSATPSVESLYNAAQGKYAFAQLTERYQGVSLPVIELINARSLEASRKKGFHLLTPELQEAMKEALENKRQIILFQNRRGYAPFQICTACGWVPQCPNCAVSLTYHKSSDRMHCHYCGTVRPVFHICAQCGSNKISSRSFGTERIEEEVRAAFPEAKVARMDLDAMRGKHALSRLLEDLENRQIDILVGTQMVVKGLDFAPVSLVGVLSADALLSYPDFRVNERAFQLMEQVSGRAGRSDGAGRVLIQAYQLDHPVLQWVIDHDVQAFYRHEAGYREFFHFPPYVRMIKVVCRHADEEKAATAAAAMAASLQQAEGITVQGPVPAVVSRVRNQYVQEVWIKMPRQLLAIEKVKAILKDQRLKVLAARQWKRAQIYFDVDPV